MASLLATPTSMHTTNKPHHTFRGHTYWVLCVEFSPNGEYVITGSGDNTAKLWRVKDGTLVHTFQGHTGYVLFVAFSPNGEYVLTGSSDKTAKLWLVKHGTLVHTFQGHTKTVVSIAFSPNGEYALTGSWDNTAKLWKLNDGTLVHTFRGHKKEVHSVAFSPNGEYVVTGSGDDTAKLWKVNDGTLILTFEGHQSEVHSVTFSPNGEYVVTGSWDNTAKLWNVKNRTLVHTFLGRRSNEPLFLGDVDSVAFSPNSEYVLIGSWDNIAKLWNVNDGKLVHTFQGHTDYVYSIAFSPNGEYVLTGSGDKTAKLWNVKDGTLTHTFRGHKTAVESVAFSPNGKYILTGSPDMTAQLWKVPKSLIPDTTDSETVSQPLAVGLLSSKENIQSCGLLNDGNHKQHDSTFLACESPGTSPLTNMDNTNASSPLLRPNTNAIISANTLIPSEPQPNPINLKLLHELQLKEEYLANLINNTSNIIETGLSLLSQYPDELQSILYEKTQSVQEEMELAAIMSSREHCDFYIHLVCKLNGMMKACETIACGMVSKADASFQDYVHDLIMDGTMNAVKNIHLGKALGGAIEWMKKQLGSIPCADAIGSFLQLACEFKSEREQHLAIGRVAFISALSDIKHNGGINGTVQRIARYIVRVQASELSALQQSHKFGRMKQLWTTAMAISADTPAKEQGSKVADLVIGVIMKPNKNTDLYSVMQGHAIHQPIALHEIIVAAALDMPMDNVRALPFFSGSDDSNTYNVGVGSAGSTTQEQYPIAISSHAVVSNDINSTSSNPHAAAMQKEFDEMKMALVKVQKQNEMLFQQNETVTKKIAKLEKEKHDMTVQGKNGLVQAYVNPYDEASRTHHATTKRMDRVERTIVEIQKNLIEASEKIVEHEEHLRKKKNTMTRGSNEHSRNSTEKQKRDAKEKQKRIERQRLELFHRQT